MECDTLNSEIDYIKKNNVKFIFTKINKWYIIIIVLWNILVIVKKNHFMSN